MIKVTKITEEEVLLTIHISNYMASNAITD